MDVMGGVAGSAVVADEADVGEAFVSIAVNWGKEANREEGKSKQLVKTHFFVQILILLVCKPQAI